MSKIYIDLGAHVGRTVAAALARDFDEVYAFEPNPAALAHSHWERVINDPRLTIVDSAAWIKDGYMPMYREPRIHYECYGDSQGATLVAGKTSGGISYTDGSIEISTIDFPEWINSHTTNGDRVTVKMDIEGAEYIVLPACIEQKALESVSHFYIEFHRDKLEFETGCYRRAQQIENNFRHYCQINDINLEEATH